MFITQQVIIVQRFTKVLIHQRIVQAMGEEWELMYDESHIKQVMTRYAVDKGWRL